MVSVDLGSDPTNVAAVRHGGDSLLLSFSGLDYVLPRNTSAHALERFKLLPLAEPVSSHGIGGFSSFPNPGLFVIFRLLCKEIDHPNNQKAAHKVSGIAYAELQARLAHLILADLHGLVIHGNQAYESGEHARNNTT